MNIFKEDGGMIMKRFGLIYMYTNNINGKKYIGQTLMERESVRKKEHIKKALHTLDNLHFHNALRYYGVDNFTYEVLENNISTDILDEKEMYYIEKHDTFNNGYNMTVGGNWLGRGKDHPSCKDITYHHNVRTTECLFKRQFLRSHDAKMEDFIKVYCGRERSVSKYYFFYHKDYLPDNIEELVKASCEKERLEDIEIEKERRSKLSNGRKGSSNPKAISKEDYANKLTFKNSFKTTCKRMCWNFEDFEEVWDGDYHTTKGGHKYKLFRYIYNNTKRL